MARPKPQRNKPQASFDGGMAYCVMFAALLAVVAIVYQMTRHRQLVATLREHLIAGKARLHCTTPGNIDRGNGISIRGLLTECDVAEGDEITYIPASLILSQDTSDSVVQTLVDESLSGSSGKSSLEIVRRDLTLAASFLRELARHRPTPHREEASEFSAYLGVASLSDAGNTPDNFALWDQAQREAIGSVMWDSAVWKDLAAKSLQKIVKKNSVLFGKANKDTQNKALSLVASRQFGGALVPWVDFINHDLDPNTHHSCSADGCRLTAMRPLKAGDEITIYYGAKSNLHLLSGYGFDLGEANNISAFAVDLDPEMSSNCEDAEKAVLDLEAPMGLPEDVLECVTKNNGRKAVLQAALSACSNLNKEFKSGSHILAVGKPGPEEALRALAKRTPAKPIDSAISRAVQAELDAASRCEFMARGELEALKA